MKGELNLISILALVIIASLLALGFAAMNFVKVKKMDEGTDKMAEIASAIRIGANAFINYEYKILLIVTSCIFVALCILVNFYTALAFVIGAVMSASAGYVGMKIATYANVRVANEARVTKKLGSTLKVAFRGGSVMGLCVGGFALFGMLIDAVANAARRMVDEVRRQFNEIPGILDGTANPDYKTCIEISSQGALREMKTPSMLAMIVPVVCGFLFGPAFVGGILIGSTVSAVMLAIFTGNAGGAWDNAKKYIETGALKGHKKGSPAHSAAVVGDTVGDPLKDTVGPSLDIFIKIMSVVSLVTISIFSKYNLVNLLKSLLSK